MNNEYQYAVDQASKHLVQMAETLERAAKEMRRNAEHLKESGEMLLQGQKVGCGPLQYYSFGLNDWTNVQTNLRLDLVPNYSAALVLKQPA
jgi:hypothetical protein